MGRWIAGGLIVLLCSIDCASKAEPLSTGRADERTEPQALSPKPPSMAGWSRVPDLQYQFEKDFKDCTRQLKPVPSLKIKPVDFTECMRSLGWEKK